MGSRGRRSHHWTNRSGPPGCIFNISSVRRSEQDVEGLGRPERSAWSDQRGPAPAVSLGPLPPWAPLPASPRPPFPGSSRLRGPCASPPCGPLAGHPRRSGCRPSGPRTRAPPRGLHSPQPGASARTPPSDSVGARTPRSPEAPSGSVTPPGTSRPASDPPYTAGTPLPAPRQLPRRPRGDVRAPQRF